MKQSEQLLTDAQSVLRRKLFSSDDRLAMQAALKIVDDSRRQEGDGSAKSVLIPTACMEVFTKTIKEIKQWSKKYGDYSKYLLDSSSEG